MRIAMVGLRAPTAQGGVEQVVRMVGPRLVAMGCKVTVFCRGRYNSHGSMLDGMELVNLPALYTKHLEAISHTALALVRSCRQDFDIVHIHAAGPALLGLLPKLAGKRTVVTLHARDWERAKWGPLARMALRAGATVASLTADRLIAVSNHVADAAHDADVTVIPNGVEAIPHTPLAEAAVPGLQSGYLLYLGRIVPEKRIELALRAHAAARCDLPLVITGDPGHGGTYMQMLRRIAGPRVYFTGARYDAQKHALLTNAGAMMFPSAVEGHPIGLLEALAAGCCPLASRIPAHEGILEDPQLGVLLDHSLSAWTAALSRLAETSAGFSAAAARRHVEQKYSWDPIAERMLALYRQTAESQWA